MKNSYKLSEDGKSAVIQCLEGFRVKYVTVDADAIDLISKVDGEWAIKFNPRYPEEPNIMTVATDHNGEFVDMKRLIAGLQHLD